MLAMTCKSRLEKEDNKNLLVYRKNNKLITYNNAFSLR